MSGKYILEANNVIALFAGEQSVLDQLKDAAEIYIPNVVIGEMYYGAHKSSQTNKNLGRIEAFVAANIVLACGAVTTFHYMATSRSNYDKSASQFLKIIFGSQQLLNSTTVF